MGRDGRNVRLKCQGQGFRHNGFYLLVPGLPHHQVLQQLGKGVRQLHAFLDIRRIMYPQHFLRSIPTARNERQELARNPEGTQRRDFGRFGYRERFEKMKRSTPDL